MDMSTSNSTLMMKKSLDYLWQKQSAILDNIANVETPGYKAKYVTFEDSLNDALRTSVTGENVQRDSRRAIGEASIEVHTAETESTRLDDNGVNITEQSVELSRNGYQMQYVMNAISTDYQILRTAISG